MSARKGLGGRPRHAIPAAALLSACLLAGCALPPEKPPVPRASPPPVVVPPLAVEVPPAPQVPPEPKPAAPPEPMFFPKDLAASTPAEIEARQVIDLIAYANRVAGMPAEEQRREVAAANQEYTRDSGARSRVRLAVLLALPGTPIHDDGRAASLLEPLAASGATTAPLRQFASLLHGQVSERLREQKKSAQLKEQIDGLRAIERSLIERERVRK